MLLVFFFSIDECGIQTIAHTVAAADNVPVLGRSFCWNTSSYRSSYLPTTSLMQIEAENAKTLHIQFQKLTSEDKSHLRVPLQKLSECSAGSISSVQGAIDLRVALESIFLGDDAQGEMTYRLGLRAAIFHGGDLDTKISTQKLMKSAYGLCSHAVHKGRLKSNANNSQSLGEAHAIAKSSIIKMIQNGIAKPKWSEIELTGSAE